MNGRQTSENVLYLHHSPRYTKAYQPFLQGRRVGEAESFEEFSSVEASIARRLFLSPLVESGEMKFVSSRVGDSLMARTNSY